MSNFQANILADEYGIGRGNFATFFGIWAEVTGVNDLNQLKARRTELLEASEALLALADNESRDLSDEESEQIATNAEESEKILKRINAQETVERLRQGQGRRSVSDDAARGNTTLSPSRTVPASPRADPRTCGFRHMGDFASVVYQAALRDEPSMNRLRAMNEGTGEDGGFLVPPEFRDSIMRVVEGEDSLLSRTDSSFTARNSVSQPIDETTPWGTTGIQVYWEGEGQSTTTSGAKFGMNNLRLNKLMARVDVSEELLDDAPQLDNYLRVKAPEVMTQVINLSIVSGNGVGKPLGIMNSGCLVTVAAETSQPADTFFHRNAVKMMARMYAPCWPRSAWLINQDVFPQLHLMSFRDVGAYPSTATQAASPAYMPPNSLLAGAPFGTLLGRPILPLQCMETLGDLGDVILADMSKYRTITKTGGARVDTSIHLKFDTDETVFRFIFRLAGTPWWSKAISPRDGNNTMSCFVTLASR